MTQLVTTWHRAIVHITDNYPWRYQGRRVLEHGREDGMLLSVQNNKVEMDYLSIKLQIVFLSVFVTEDSFVDISYLVFKIHCFKLRTFTCAHKYFFNVLFQCRYWGGVDWTVRNPVIADG